MSEAKKPAPKKKNTKLAIVGTATNYQQAPWDDKEVDIWAVSSLITMPGVKRLSAIFELHPRRYWGQAHVIEQLNCFRGPCYMQDHYDEIPKSVAYPIDDVQKEFYRPTMGKSLFVTNTIGFMFALAYLKGYTHVETWGMYMEHDTEYGYQKPNCEFFVGYLMGKGVNVEIHGGEVLKASFLYGYEEPVLLDRLLADSKQIEGGMQKLREELNAKQREVYMQEGGMQYNKRLRRELGGY